MNPVHWQNRSPGDLSILLPEVSATPVEPVLVSARQAAVDWARQPLSERISAIRVAQLALEEHREELAHGIALETGKPITEARGEVGAVLAKFDLTIDDASRELAQREVVSGPHPGYVRRRARGPAAVVGPFNFPIHLANGALLAHLLAGNPVIFKPSPLAAVVAGRYAELMKPCFPAGVFNLVQGGAAEGSAVCLDPRVRSVCFTGSVPVGRSLARALAEDFSKELALELGGRNAAIVCVDADLGLAARAIADAACLTCGQRCNATSRVLVDRSVAGQFIGLLVEALEQFLPGDPMDTATKLGPLISAHALERYQARIEVPGEWIVPGAVPVEVAGKRGYYVRPAVLEGVLSDQGMEGEAESFLPILELEVVEELNQAVQRHNASPYGMTASVFTRDQERFWRLADELHVANVYANLPTTFSPSTLPFGGWGLSGNGRPGGRGFIRFTTAEQAIQLAEGTFSGA